MSTHIKVGSVVDLVLNTGMQQGIILHTEGENVSGVLVSNNDHRVITGDFNVKDYEVISTYDEKAFVISGEYNNVVLFQDDQGLYLCVEGDEGNGRPVKTIPGALKVLNNTLHRLGETATAKRIEETREFSLNFLSDIFDMPAE